jgi:hypothetical protein
MTAEWLETEKGFILLTEAVAFAVETRWRKAQEFYPIIQITINGGATFPYIPRDCGPYKSEKEAKEQGLHYARGLVHAATNARLIAQYAINQPRDGVIPRDGEYGPAKYGPEAVEQTAPPAPTLPTGTEPTGNQ